MLQILMHSVLLGGLSFTPQASAIESKCNREIQQALATLDLQRDNCGTNFSSNPKLLAYISKSENRKLFVGFDSSSNATTLTMRQSGLVAQDEEVILKLDSDCKPTSVSIQGSGGIEYEANQFQCSQLLDHKAPDFSDEQIRQAIFGEKTNIHGEDAFTLRRACQKHGLGKRTENRLPDPAGVKR